MERGQAFGKEKIEKHDTNNNKKLIYIINAI